MKNKVKVLKIFSLIMAVVLLMSAFPLSTFAAEIVETGKCGENLTYTLDSEGLLTISGEGKMDSYPEAAISPFYDNLLIKSVVIKDGVTSIDGPAFYGCTGLTSITIPDSVTSIGDYAFDGCTGLTGIIIPDSVTSIGDYAFDGCTGLTGIIIPDSVTSIGKRAFRDCTGLTSITIPNSVTSIGDDAFYHINNIIYHGTASGSPWWGAKAVNGYVEDGLVYTDSSKEILAGCFMTKNGDIIIPDSVTSIGSYAFENCTDLTSITIPDSVTSIGDYAFYHINNIIYHGTASGSPWEAKAVNGYVEDGLVYKDSSKKILAGCFTAKKGDITIPDSVTDIDYYAFENCTGLTSITVDSGNQYYSNDSYGVLFNKNKTELIKYPIGNMRTSYTIPNSVTSIGDSAFSGCTSLTGITIPDSVTSIGYHAFEGCHLENVKMGDGLTYIPSTLVVNYYLKTFVIGNSVKSIDYYAFSRCTRLTSIEIPDSVTSIGDYAFSRCTGLTSIEIPDSVTSIGYDVFKGCTSLTSITIPNSVTSIGDYAFSGCTGLTNIEIPDSVTSIGWYAFSGCTGLTNITVDSGNQNYSSDSYGVLFNKDKTELIKYPIGNKRTSYTIPNSVTSIGYGAFDGCTSLTSVTIPNSVTSIGNGAFYGFTGLTSITIPDSVTSIGNDAFYGCTGLTNVTIPNSVTSIGIAAFADCTGLTNVTIPNSVTSIGIAAFADCTGLTSVTIPDSVTSIDEDAFYGCTGLKEVYLGKNVSSIGSFVGCRNLSILTITSEEFSDDETIDLGIDNLTFVINEKNTRAINYAKNKGYKVITFNYSDAEKCLKFNGNTVIYQGLEYKYLPELINNCPDVDKLYFQRLEFDGVEPEIIKIDFDKLDKESENLAFNNLYVDLKVIRNGTEEEITFAEMQELIETGEYEAFGINVTSDEGTFFEKIFQKVEELFVQAIRVITKVINLVASIFKKK